MWFVYAKAIVSDKSLNRILKQQIREVPFFQYLFKEYEVPIENIEKNLIFHIKKMRGRSAFSKGNDIYINSELLQTDNFFSDGLHFVIHELVHWLTRQREETCYLSDPEEVDAFTAAILFELLRGKNKEDISRTFLPILASHFDPSRVVPVFDALYSRAMAKGACCGLVQAGTK